MKEQINFTLTNLDDYNLTFRQLLVLFEKLLTYYSETDINKLTNLIDNCGIYFTIVYNLVQKTIKESEQEEE